MSNVPVSKLGDFVPLLQPSRPVLVTSRFKDGRIDVAPFSWCIPASVSPPMLILALATIPRRQRSLLNILNNGEFVVNLPGAELAERLARSSYFYPKGINKLEHLDYQTAPGQVLDLPILTECRAHVECRLIEAIPTGDHTTLIANVVAASYESELYDDKMILKLDKAAPLMHLRHHLSPDGQGQTFYFLSADCIRSLYLDFPPGGLDANGRPVADEED
jgi:flavin reductase (DIM6/NTAB) family NADH-FMN oxidoreductase RutF